MKAMILTAGLGTRMQHLSKSHPKCLLPVLNIPLIHHQLFQLEESGFSDVILNLHHLGNKIKEKVGNSFNHIKIQYSEEYPHILGTGGGLRNAASFFKKEKTFVILNNDSISDLNLEKALSFHEKNKALATLYIKPRLTPYHGLNIDENNKVINFSNTGKYMFCGVHIAQTEMLDHLIEGPSCIIKDGYEKWIKENRKIMGFLNQSNWYDFGTIENYLNLQLQILSNLKNEAFMLKTLKYFYPSLTEKQEGIWYMGKCNISKNVQLIPPLLIGENVVVEGHASIGPSVILGHGLHIKENSILKGSIFFEDVAIKA